MLRKANVLQYRFEKFSILTVTYAWMRGIYLLYYESAWSKVYYHCFNFDFSLELLSSPLNGNTIDVELKMFTRVHLEQKGVQKWKIIFP